MTRNGATIRCPESRCWVVPTTVAWRYVGRVESKAVERTSGLPATSHQPLATIPNQEAEVRR